MKRSTSIALWSWTLWLVLMVIAGIALPQAMPSFERMILDPAGSKNEFAWITLFTSLGHISFAVAIISTAILAFQSIISKTVTKTEYNGPVNHTIITASDHAAIAMNDAKIDQCGKIIDQRITIQNLGDLSPVLDDLAKFISESGLSERDKRYGALLIYNAKLELEHNTSDGSKITEYLRSIVDLVKSTSSITEAAKQAIELIKTLVE